MKKMNVMKIISSFCTYLFKPDIGALLSRRSFLHGIILSLGALLMQLPAGSPAQAHGNRVRAGDILVVDARGGTDGSGALFVVNPKTGRRAVLSDFGNSTQGPLGREPHSVAVGSRGQIFVSELFIRGSSYAGALYGVDPDTGNRTLLSNFDQGDIQGPLYHGLAVDAKGRVIANLDRSQPPAYELDFAVVRIRPETDRRVLVSDLKNPAQGQVLSAVITDLTLESKGTILIGTGTADSDAIFRVNPITGRRKLVSDFANPGQGNDVGGLQSVTGLAAEASGTILAASGGVFYAPRNLLFRIHPRTGQRAVLSDFDDPGQGVLGYGLSGVGVETSGKIIVAAGDPSIGSATLLFRVDPKTGQRVVLSDSANAAQGPSFQTITYIAIVPDRDPGGHDTDDNAEDDD